jgi:hypothetical protein
MPDTGYELKLSDSEMGDLIRYRRDRDVLLVHPKRPADVPEPPAEKVPDKQASADDAAKSAPDKPVAEGAEPAAHPPTDFVDRQLRQAVDYLTRELAGAK